MKTYDTVEVTAWIDVMVDELHALLQQEPDLALIGIRRGGVDVARHLASGLAARVARTVRHPYARASASASASAGAGAGAGADAGTGASATAGAGAGAGAGEDTVDIPFGELDVAFYRDDFDRIGLHPIVGPSMVPFDLDDRHIVLVDDVLSSGRTVRAAMNELFDHGRPARITLAVLVQRHGHELPIRADVVGHALDVTDDGHVELDASAMIVRVGARDELARRRDEVVQ